MDYYTQINVEEILSFDYGTVLKELRKSRKVSQLELEVRAGLNSGVVSRIENGKVNPTKETLLKIAYVLKLKKDEVISLFNIHHLPF